MIVAKQFQELFFWLLEDPASDALDTGGLIVSLFSVSDIVFQLVALVLIL